MNPANTDALGYNDFMGRAGSELCLSKALVPVTSEEGHDGALVIAIAVSAPALLGAAGLFLPFSVATQESCCR